MADLIVVEDLAAPAVAGRGGHASWVVQFLRGLARLGHRVLFVEFLDRAPDPTGAAWFRTVVDECWSLSRAALLHGPDWRSAAGVDREAVAAAAGSADALITLSAHYRSEPWPLLGRVRPRILWDVDPGYTHLWAAAGDPASVFGCHDVHFTVGILIGTAGCRVPTGGIEWVPTLNPVLLEAWPAPSAPAARPGARIGTVAGWRDYGWLEFEGSLLGPKAEEFRRFLALPELTGEPLELVVDLHPDDPDRRELEQHGWVILPPSRVRRPSQFRDHVRASAGEFSCAKGGYVGTRCGWFSERSAGYLAAGRPVVAQATGFEEVLPTGEGLFAVHDVEEAAAAVREVRRRPEHHAAGARALAVEHFDSDKVLGRMLRRAGVG